MLQGMLRFLVIKQTPDNNRGEWDHLLACILSRNELYTSFMRSVKMNSTHFTAYRGSKHFNSFFATSTP